MLTQPDPPPQKPKIKIRKTPATVVTMKQIVNTTPSAAAINLQDLIVDAPLAAAKPRDKIRQPQVPKLSTPPK